MIDPFTYANNCLFLLKVFLVITVPGVVRSDSIFCVDHIYLIVYALALLVQCNIIKNASGVV